MNIIELNLDCRKVIKLDSRKIFKLTCYLDWIDDMYGKHAHQETPQVL